MFLSIVLVLSLTSHFSESKSESAFVIKGDGRNVGPNLNAPGRSLRAAHGRSINYGSGYTNGYTRPNPNPNPNHSGYYGGQSSFYNPSSLGSKYSGTTNYASVSKYIPGSSGTPQYSPVRGTTSYTGYTPVRTNGYQKPYTQTPYGSQGVAVASPQYGYTQQYGQQQYAPYQQYGSQLAYGQQARPQAGLLPLQHQSYPYTQSHGMPNGLLGGSYGGNSLLGGGYGGNSLLGGGYGGNSLLGGGYGGNSLLGGGAGLGGGILGNLMGSLFG
ncbi:unnamed protein product [Cyprideis torosa]|uniref:Uncharacterized protein n=1 Tax=Cyprideis torosa TaxID=163714 RepID=A0A7R8WN00_9CRUS|nr:unnamed protein product [Cyprideis torosa]CAG0900085.1 unnamed protein product [Cyprideis torosa]